MKIEIQVVEIRQTGFLLLEKLREYVITFKIVMPLQGYFKQGTTNWLDGEKHK